MEIKKPTEERLRARMEEAARKEREMLRPYTVDGYHFKATSEDALAIEGAEPFEGERFDQPTEENGLKKVEAGHSMTVYKKSDDAKSRFPYRKYIVDADDLADFWLTEMGMKTEVAKLDKKKPAPKKAAPKKEDK